MTGWLKKVVMPDGTVRAFSSAMSDEDIARAIAYEFPPPPPPPPPISRSPRAMPLPRAEWAPPVVPPDEGPWPARKPEVILHYANAKQHLARQYLKGTHMTATVADLDQKREALARRLQVVQTPPAEVVDLVRKADAAVAGMKAQTAGDRGRARRGGFGN